MKRLAPKNNYSEPKVQGPLETNEIDDTDNYQWGALVKTKKPLEREADKELEKNDNATFTDIYISDYTPKSFIVMGNTLSHANNLGKLGGKPAPLGQLGTQWLFAGYRRESVKNYIETGQVVPAKWTGATNSSTSTTPGRGSSGPRPDYSGLFEEFKNAFEKDAEYTGESILEVIQLLQQKYC